MSGNFYKTERYTSNKQTANVDNFHFTKLFDCDSQKGIKLPADTSICGTHITIAADSSFVKYVWNTGSLFNQIVIDTTGTYSLSVTDKFGCISADTMQVTINHPPIVDLGETVYMTNNEPSILFGPACMLEYTWSDGSSLPYFSLSEIIQYPAEITLKVRDEIGCEGMGKVLVISKSSSPKKPTGELMADVFSVEMYPNPVLDILNIDIFNINTSEKLLLEVFSADGKLLISRDLQTNKLDIHESQEFNSLPSGTYTMIVNNGNNNVRMTVVKL